ncbi:MAG: Hsp20/alpha crystallin family protein [SAR324 cluster bacterium]|nr:Hsp20/alpha crystallin family protein [SAR324 cluster bacterium]
MTTTEKTADKATNKATFLPQVDVIETKQGYRLLLDVPGVTKEDVKISFEKGKLIVAGDISRGLDQGAKYLRKIKLSDALDTGSIKAKLDEGVLDVAIAKKPEALAVQVEIN